MAVPEWMRQNLARLWAEYQEKISSRSNTGKGLTPPQGRVWMLMEHRWLWMRMKWLQER